MTDRMISVSDQTGRVALEHGIGRPEQHITIFSGMELDRFLDVGSALSVVAAKERAGIEPDAPVVGKIARFFPLKGHEQFLVAAIEIVKQEPRVKFLLVGDGPYREEFEAHAGRAGVLDRIVFAGRVPPEDVPIWIQAMDVVVHTSLREGIARVLPQAGAVGKPVVTFALDGAPEVILDGISGFLVPPLDTAALAARVVQLLRDDHLRTKLGSAGRAFAADHFGLQTMVDRISDVYFEALARKGLSAGPSETIPSSGAASRV